MGNTKRAFVGSSVLFCSVLFLAEASVLAAEGFVLTVSSDLDTYFTGMTATFTVTLTHPDGTPVNMNNRKLVALFLDANTEIPLTQTSDTTWMAVVTLTGAGDQTFHVTLMNMTGQGKAKGSGTEKPFAEAEKSVSVIPLPPITIVSLSGPSGPLPYDEVTGNYYVNGAKVAITFSAPGATRVWIENAAGYADLAGYAEIYPVEGENPNVTLCAETVPGAVSRAAFSLVKDTVPPAVTLVNPSKTTTRWLGYLLCGPATIADRNVWGDGQPFTYTVKDETKLATPASFKHKAMAEHTGDNVFPFYQYGVEPPYSDWRPGMETIQSVVVEPDDMPHEVSAAPSGYGSNDEKVHVYALHVRDFAGNEAYSEPIFFKCDTAAPRLCEMKSQADIAEWGQWLADNSIGFQDVDVKISQAVTNIGLDWKLTDITAGWRWLTGPAPFVVRIEDHGCGLSMVKVKQRYGTEWVACRRVSPGSSYWFPPDREWAEAYMEPVEDDYNWVEYTLEDLAGNTAEGAFARAYVGSDRIYYPYRETWHDVVTYYYGGEEIRTEESTHSSETSIPVPLAHMTWTPYRVYFADEIYHYWHMGVITDPEPMEEPTFIIDEYTTIIGGNSVLLLPDLDTGLSVQDAGPCQVALLSPMFPVADPVGVPVASQSVLEQVRQQLALGAWQLYIDPENNAVEAFFELGKAAPEDAGAASVSVAYTELGVEAGGDGWTTPAGIMVPGGDSRAGLRAMGVYEEAFTLDEYPDTLPDWFDSYGFGTHPVRALLPARLPVIDVWPDVFVTGQERYFKVRGWFPRRDGTWLKEGDDVSRVTVKLKGWAAEVQAEVLGIEADDPFNVENVKALACRIEIPEEEAVTPGLYDVEVSYPDVSGPRTFTLKDAVNVIKLEFIRLNDQKIKDDEPIAVVDAATLMTLAGYDAEEHSSGVILPGDYLTPYEVSVVFASLLNESKPDTVTATVTRISDSHSVTGELTETGNNTRIFRSADGRLVMNLIQGGVVESFVDVLSVAMDCDDLEVHSFYSLLIETDVHSLRFKSKKILLRVEFTDIPGTERIDTIRAAVCKIGQVFPLVEELRETDLASLVFEDRTRTFSVKLIRLPSFVPDGADDLYATITKVDTGIQDEPTYIEETGTNTLVFEDVMFVEEGFDIRPTPPAPPVLPNVSEYAQFKLRITDMLQDAGTFDVELRAVDSTGNVIDRVMVRMSAMGDGIFVSDKPILSFEGTLPAIARAKFTDYYLVDGDRYEFTYKDIDKKQVTLRVYLTSRRKPSNIPQWDEAKHVLTDNTQPPVAEYDTDIEIYAVVRWQKENQEPVFYCGYTTDTDMPQKAIIEGKERALERWDVGKLDTLSFSWVLVTPDYTKTLSNSVPWADQEYVETPLEDMPGWKYVLPKQAGVRRFALDVGYKDGVFETVDSFERQDSGKYDRCINDKVMRIIVKGNFNFPGGNNEYLNWAAAYLGVAWTMGSYWKHQTKRYICVDCADLAMAAYEDWTKGLPNEVNEYNGPQAFIIWKWADVLYPTKLRVVDGPRDALDVAESVLKPGDIILLGYANPQALKGFNAYHTVIFVEHDGSGRLSAGDTCIMANSTHEGGPQNQVGICRFDGWLGTGKYAKAVVIRPIK